MYNEVKKIGRNEPCFCGSGLKYKKCCLKVKQAKTEEIRFKNAQANIKQKMKHTMGKEVVFLNANSHPLKMSEIILEFAQDMLRLSRTKAEKRKAIDLACMAWNLAIFKEKDEEEYKKQWDIFLEQLPENDPQMKANLISLIEALVNEKIEYYSSIKRIIADYQVDFHGSELMLNVASLLSAEEVSEYENE